MTESPGKTESFLIHVTGDKVVVSRAKNTSTNRWDSYGLISLKDVPIPALQVGCRVLDMLATLEGGHTIGHIDVQDVCNDEQAEYTQITVRAVPIEPPEPVGVEWLKLQGFEILICPISGYRFMVTDHGLAWLEGTLPLWRWDGTKISETGELIEQEWREIDWVRHASADTIKPWVAK